MKEFLQLMRRFVSPYKKYIGWAVLLNILSAVFNVFSFTFLIPILSILFKTEGADKVYHFMEWGSGDLADVAKNNFYYYISQMIIDNGPTMALIFLGLFLMIMTLFKTGCYFASSAVMIPLRTGVVRDIRIMVYAKVMRLPMSFFSEERKGDIIARMSGDVGEVENSITSSLDMLMKSPIMIILYFATLVITSWQLTLFTIVVLPGDLIFFQGTYNTPGASHVGIYVGGGKMLHCGDPIQYADINTSYWQSHFYAFGRPPYN
jgi:ATP-binding cassette subfamily B protein/subfamily B ATP-binding cassette protein MsbA